MFQEVFLDPNRPGQGVQHADLASQTGQGGIEFGQRDAHGDLLGGKVSLQSLVAADGHFAIFAEYAPCGTVLGVLSSDLMCHNAILWVTSDTFP
ncbi:hypothetical protein D3C76_1591460 [compost metagenome]